MTELLNMPGSGLVVLIVLSLIVYWVIRMTQSRGEEEIVAAAQAAPAAPVPAIDEDSYAVLLAAVSEDQFCKGFRYAVKAVGRGIPGGKYKRTLKKY